MLLDKDERQFTDAVFPQFSYIAAKFSYTIEAGVALWRHRPTCYHICSIKGAIHNKGTPAILVKKFVLAILVKMQNNKIANPYRVFASSFSSKVIGIQEHGYEPYKVELFAGTFFTDLNTIREITGTPKFIYPCLMPLIGQII